MHAFALLAVGGNYLGFFAGSAALAVIDARTKRLPKKIVFPLYGLALSGLGTAGVITGSWHRIAIAAGCGLTLSIVFAVSWYFGPTGYGDVRLAGLLGIEAGWFGVRYLYAGLLVGMVVGALVMVGLIAAQRAQRRQTTAFGPILIAGAWIGIIMALAGGVSLA